MKVAGNRDLWKLAGVGLLALAAFAALVSLGVWQVQRLSWKRDLIQRVEQRIHAPAQPAPGPGQWPSLTASQFEYARVRVQGHYLHDRETLVRAVTVIGPGFWVMTPFVTTEGHTVLINRGFVPPTRRDADTRPAGQVEGEVTVTGLLRTSETKGSLQANDSATGRWYSRDVSAICKLRCPANFAPYFIDAEALEPAIDTAPVGGLTVVKFSNNHLQYALTWFALAIMLAGWMALVIRHEWRHERRLRRT